MCSSDAADCCRLIACCSVLGSFILSVLVFWTTADITSHAPSAFGPFTQYAVGSDYGTWFSTPGFTVHLGLLADHLSRLAEDSVVDMPADAQGVLFGQVARHHLFSQHFGNAAAVEFGRSVDSLGVVAVGAPHDPVRGKRVEPFVKAGLVKRTSKVSPP